MALFGFGSRKEQKGTSPSEAEKTDISASEPEERAGLFGRFFKGLAKTRTNVSGQVDDLVSSTEVIDEDFFESLLDILVMSDMGIRTSERVIETLKERVAQKGIRRADEARQELKAILKERIARPREPLAWPMVLLVVGVNGVGKTTTIGKLALRFKNARHSVVLVAADTFRAAAAEQLSIWSERAGVPLVRHHEGADPAAVVFDGLARAKATEADLVIVDTAGRLHNKRNLMEELTKIARVIEKESAGANVRTLLVLDATTGQNGLQQARVFKEAANLSGIVLTKLDGTAKGGIVFAILEELDLPVLYVGMGEGIDDLQAFDADAFVEAIF